MITVLFFAQVRELTGVERLTLEAGFPTVEALRQALAGRGDRWAPAMKWRFSRRSPEAEWTLP